MRRVAIGVLLATLALAACNGDDEETAETGEGPTSTTDTTAGSTTSAPATATTAPAGLEQPALWPAPDVVFDDPVEAATDFLDQVLGAGEAGEFRAGDNRSGEVDAIFTGEGGGQSIVRSTLLLRQLGPDSGWFVIAAVNPNAAITTPSAGAEVPAGPVTVEGVGRGFEATLNVVALEAGDADAEIDRQIAMGGAQAEPLPFTTTLDLVGVEPGTVVTLLVRGDTGLETDPGDFGAIPVVVEA